MKNCENSKKKIFLSFYICAKTKKKDISIKNVFFGNIAAKFPYCVLYTTPINTFYELFAFSLCFFFSLIFFNMTNCETLKKR